jgi:hypothetical protein
MLFCMHWRSGTDERECTVLYHLTGGLRWHFGAEMGQKGETYYRWMLRFDNSTHCCQVGHLAVWFTDKRVCQDFVPCLQVSHWCEYSYLGSLAYQMVADFTKGEEDYAIGV